MRPRPLPLSPRGAYQVRFLLAVNHERWVINCRIARYSRLMFEETWKWAHLRKSQGKRLIDNAVIRQKFGHMIAKIDAGQAWLEHLTYQM